MEARKLRVGISGSYGGINLGDEAILHVILSLLRRSLPVEVTVFTRDAEDTRRRHHVEHAVQLRTRSRREARDIVAGLDLLILGGGGILYDLDAEMFLREVFLAGEVGTPVMTYAIGVGPLRDAHVRSRVRQALERADVITVRDHGSQRLLEEVGVERDIVVTADPAVLLEPEPLPREELVRTEAVDPDMRLIAFSVREPGPAASGRAVERAQRLVAEAADFLIDRLDADAIFIPLEWRGSDVQHSHSVVGQMRHARRATVLRREYTPGQCVSLLQHFDFAVGMRLHFLVFSALAGLPFVAVPYARKVTGLLEELGLPACLDQVGVAELMAQAARVWEQRGELRARVQVGLAELRRRAVLSNEYAVGLLSRAAEREAARHGPAATAPRQEGHLLPSEGAT